MNNYRQGILLAIITFTMSIVIPTISSAKNKEVKQTPVSAAVKYIAIDTLPDLTRQMYEDLVEASQNGDLEEVRDLFESNELAPVLSNEHTSDPLEYWKKVSIDGSARDILAAISEVFSLPPVKNKNGDYIWPYLAQTPLNKLTKQQQIDLFRLVGPKQATEMLKSGKYTYYEAKIGKDGTWHSFKKTDKTTP